MLKEFVFIAPDSDVTTVHIGIFPSQGRYFRTRMTDKGNRVFQAEVQVSKGELYYHFFLNNNFNIPYNNCSEGLISPDDPLKRSFLNIGTQPFCAVEFDTQDKHVFPLDPGHWILRAISHYSWIRSLILVTDFSGEIPFSLNHQYKNKKYWHLRLTGDFRLDVFSIKIKGSDRQLFLPQANCARQPSPQKYFFVLPDKLSFPAKPIILPYSTGYQIFPDRFFKSQRQTGNFDFSGWGGPSAKNSFFGGDLPGITEKLTYLAELGIDFLYLNPVFHARSNHRYDIIDYYKIDPLLGGGRELQELIKEAHHLGIKIVLDITLNHCSIDFFAFRDVLIHQQASKYRDWFHLDRFPVRVCDAHHYGSWYGNKEMPEFNLENREVQDYLIDACLYWQERFDIDGWRLDACSSLPPDFVRRFVQQIRVCKNDVLIIGEFWHKNAYDLIVDNGIDGITNYGFYWDVIVPFFEKGTHSVEKLADEIIKLNYKYSPRQIQYAWNFLDNHDLPRLISIINNRQLYRLAVVLMYAFPGMPVIYYGNEICLEGMNDPDNRRCMNWQRVYESTSLIGFYKSLNRIRKTYSHIFNEANIAVPFLDRKNKILMINRFIDGESLTFVFNFSKKQKKLDPGKILNKSAFRDALRGTNQDREFVLQGYGLKILYSRSKE